MRKSIVYLIFLAIVSFSCEDDFELPETTFTEPEIDGAIISVEAVRNNAYLGTGQIHTFNGTNTYMEAFVVSSDEAGNFYHELIVQDKANNPTAGIKLLLNQNSLFQTFGFGRKIFVKLDGLSVGMSNGVAVLGSRNNGDISEIPFPIIEDHVLRSTETANIQPLQVEVDDFSTTYVNMYLQVPNVQFLHNFIGEDPMSFAAEPTDEYDGERMLVNCESGSTVVLTTSTYSSFQSLTLPRGRGSVTGILSRNFNNEFYILKLNAAGDMNFDNQNRCDPEFLTCEAENTGGPELIFGEDFQSISNSAAISTVLGWENINVSGGSGVFDYKNSFGNKFVSISAYDSGESPLTAWLVSPEIDLDNSTNEELSFNIRASYANGVFLTAYVAQNYTGNPITTQWEQLNATIPLGTSGAAEHFSTSKIDISCLSGAVRIGFRYHGADPDKTTTYDIDNVRVTGNL